MTKIIYLVLVVSIQFTAVRNEGGAIEVKSFEKTEEHTFYNRSEAIDVKQKYDALAPYLGYKSVTLDSLYICKADTKKTPKP
jgi:hypothetical protein